MAIKLLHTGDLHLDAPFIFLGEKGRDQRQQLLVTLDKIIEQAIVEKIDLVLIAGDLFDSNNPSYDTIDRVISSFKILEEANIPICLIPGCHDCYNSKSVYRLYSFEEAVSNLTIFTDKITQKVFPGLDLTVHGQATFRSGAGQTLNENLTRNSNTKFHIALIHGTFGDPGNLKEGSLATKQINENDMNYVAMGHSHSFARYSKNAMKAFFCGSPEMLSLEEENSGFVAMVTIHPSGEVDVQPKRVGRCHFRTDEIKVDDITDADQITEIIKNQVNPHQYLEVRLRGSCSFDLEIDPEKLERELEPYFFKLRLLDETKPKLEEIPVGSLPENTVIGQFVKMMRDELDGSVGEEKKLAEEVLRLGVTLLRGKRSP